MDVEAQAPVVHAVDETTQVVNDSNPPAIDEPSNAAEIIEQPLADLGTIAPVEQMAAMAGAAVESEIAGENGGNNNNGKEMEGKKDVPKGKPVGFFQLFRYATPLDKFLLILGTIGGLAHGLCQPLSVVITGTLFNSFGSMNVNDSVRIATYFIYIGIAVIVSSAFQVICFQIISARMTNRLRGEFFDAVLKHDIAYYDLHGSSAGLTTVASSNVSFFKSAVGEKMGLAIQSFSQGLAGLIIGFTYAWQLALVILAFIPLIAGGAFYMGSQTNKSAKEQLQAYAEAGSVIDESLGGIRTVTAFSLQDHFVRKLKEKLVPVVQKGRRRGLTIGLGMALLFFSYQVAFAPAYWVGALLVTNDRQAAFQAHPLQNPPPHTECKVGGTIPTQCSTQFWDTNLVFQTEADVCNCALCVCGCYYPSGTFNSDACTSGGDVLLVFFSVIIGGFGLGQFFPPYQAVTLGRVAAKKIYEVIDNAPSTTSLQKEGKMISKEEVKGEIRFENAYFAYPSRPAVEVLKGTNLTLSAGKRIAICGASGSGKSSIVSLILRFYDLKSGRLTLDGVDVKELNVASMRDCIGLVSQEPILFAGVTIRENVRYGNPSATDAEVEEACKMANAHDFIMSFPSNYETILVGQSLSGGQKQRIAIARALIRNPRILILDEASAALDSESERLVNEAIDRVVSNTKRTVIVVAHRLSTIRTCEHIVVMGPPGIVVEQGSHDELMANKAAYYNMNMAAEKEGSEERSKDLDRKADGLEDVEDDEDEDDDVSNTPTQAESVTTTGADTIKKLDGDDASKMDKEAMANASFTPQAADGENTSKKKKRKDKKVPLSRIFKFSYPERFWYIPASFSSAINGSIEPLMALTLSRVIPALFYMNNAQVLSEASTYAWIFFALGCTKGIVTIVSHYTFGVIAAEMTSRVRIATYSQIINFDMAYFDEPKHNVGAMSQKLSKDAGYVKASLGDQLNVSLTVFAGLVIGLIIAFEATWKLTLVAFALFPLMGLAYGIDSYFKSSGIQRAGKGEAAAAETFSEALNGFRTVCAFGLRDRLVELYLRQLSDAYAREKKSAITEGLVYAFAHSISHFANALLFWYSAVLMRDREITFQDMLQSIMVIVFTASTAGRAFAMSPDIAHGKAAVRSIFSILDHKSKIDPSSPEGVKPSTVLGDLDFQNLSFAYPSRKNAIVLQDFSFKLPRGTVLALVGESGSGKSTIIQLLERFYDPDAGKITLDGTETRALNVKWLRSRIGLVSQEPVLFDDTIYNNIRFGLGPEAETLSEEEIRLRIETAAKDANAHDFIMKFTNGYQTMCGSKGGFLSGGQKQRVAIARALVRDPDVLLADEATSALDEESQRTVQDAIDRLLEAKKRTVIIIAHRLTTVQRADVVLVMKKGQVVESGKYDELAEKEGGYFRTLLLAQQAGGH